MSLPEFRLSESQKSKLLKISTNYSDAINMLLEKYPAEKRIPDHVVRYIDCYVDNTGSVKHKLSLTELYEDYITYVQEDCPAPIRSTALTKQQFRGVIQKVCNVWYGKLAGNRSGFKGIKLIEYDTEEWG